MADQTKTAQEQSQEAVASARNWGRQTMMHTMASRARRTNETIDDQWIRESGQRAMEYDDATWRDALQLHSKTAGDFDAAIAAYIDAILNWSAEMMSVQVQTAQETVTLRRTVIEEVDLPAIPALRNREP